MQFEHEPREIERIKSPAILYKGRIFEGATHSNALGALLKDLETSDPDLYRKVDGDEYNLVDELEALAGDSTDFEGYTTTTGRYVTREEGKKIANETRQSRPGTAHRTELYSEDMIGD